MRIDLNADVGESFGAWAIGEDEALIPLVSSVNVAAGLHAGDPVVIQRAVGLAAGHGVAIGAHPGYPDLAGFGRRDIDLSPGEIEASVLYQVGAVEAFVRAVGADLRHVKPHGALYNRACRDRAVAGAIARAVRRWSREVRLVGLPGSQLLAAGLEIGLPVLAEAFADRAYEPDGSLRDRRRAGAVIDDPGEAAAQAVSIVRDGGVRLEDGGWLELSAATICVHGDLEGAAGRARAVRAGLEAAGIEVGPPA